jgi:anti-anti-sigma factor
MSPVVKIVEPAGILDGIRGNQLRREVNELVEINPKPDIVLIDLEKVTFMDSSGLGAIVSATKTVRSAGAKLYVCSINDQVQMLFQLTRMDKVLDSFADRNEFNSQIGVNC